MTKCDICWAEFTPAVYNQKRCSEVCVRAYRAQWMRESTKRTVKAPRPAKCAQCHGAFQNTGKVNRKFCSDKCRAAGRKRSYERFQKSAKGRAVQKRHRETEKNIAYRAKYNADHKEERRVWERGYAAKNPEVRLYRILRATLGNRIGLQHAGTSQYVSYTCKQLRAHLEKQFTPGMSWENHGIHGWHIDHIRPLVAFKFHGSDGSVRHDEVRKAMALKNLQPLWAADNIRKGGR